MLKATGRGSGADILVIDKTAVAAGASGIACGVVRNNYFQPAMRELMAHSVEVWESDPEAYSYHPVGYMQISPECMREDVASIYEQQQAIGYESVFVEGAEDSTRYMKGLFDDWQAQGHHLGAAREEGRLRQQPGQHARARRQGRGRGRPHPDRRRGGGLRVRLQLSAVTALDTNRGRIACEHVVVGVGPWVNRIWNMLELPKPITVKGRDGKMHDDVPMWKYLVPGGRHARRRSRHAQDQ